MRIILSFLKKNIFAILAFGLSYALIAVTLWLNGVDITKTWYALLLAACVCFVFACVRFICHLRRHNDLTYVAGKAGSDISGLPKPLDGVEDDYQAIISRLSGELARCEKKYSASARELADYYTLWAHQIKTPIAAMRLIIKPGDDALKEELFKIEQYVDMALNLARMQSDASDYVIKKQPLDPVIRKAIRRYARLFIGKKLAVEYNGCDATVNTDGKWLGFCLEQLLSNAIKYTPSGKITITADENQATVSDTGIGIAPEILPRVFEKGFTGYAGRADEKSSGLGLYMTKTALERLGHSIAVSSNSDSGTTVTIVFAEELGRME